MYTSDFCVGKPGRQNAMVEPIRRKVTPPQPGLEPLENSPMPEGSAWTSSIEPCRMADHFLKFAQYSWDLLPWNDQTRVKAMYTRARDADEEGSNSSNVIPAAQSVEVQLHELYVLT
jgi:hypothetical protein